MVWQPNRDRLYLAQLLEVTDKLEFDGEGIRAFFPGKKAAKKPVGDGACRQNQACFRPLGFSRPLSSRAKEKQEASRENELVHFPVCPPAFSCAHGAQVGQLCWPARERFFASKLLGRGNCSASSNRLSPLAGSGEELPPRWGLGQRPILPRQIPVCQRAHPVHLFHHYVQILRFVLLTRFVYS